jgi:hypothetical protein
MYPWGHAAVGYLLLVALTRRESSDLPRTVPVVAVLVGTQFPDLVDKPLAYAGVLVSGRSLGHSLFAAAVVVAAAVAVGRRYGRRRSARAFAVGHLSHLLADSYAAALAGRWADLGFLFYPVVPPITYPADGVAPWVRLLRADLTSHQLVQLSLAAVALGAVLYGAWRRDADAGATRVEPDTGATRVEPDGGRADVASDGARES